MSIEKALADLTAAVQENTAELRGRPRLHAVDTPAKAAGKVAVQLPPSEVFKHPEPWPTTTAAPPAPFPKYEAVSAKIIEVVQKVGKPQAIAIVNSFKAIDGVPATKGDKLQPKDYADVIAACDKALAGGASGTDII